MLLPRERHKQLPFAGRQSGSSLGWLDTAGSQLWENKLSLLRCNSDLHSRPLVAHRAVAGTQKSSVFPSPDGPYISKMGKQSPMSLAQGQPASSTSSITVLQSSYFKWATSILIGATVFMEDWRSDHDGWHLSTLLLLHSGS
jgi:hypothetical protein